MENKIAYCGLNCETCDARIATINNDDNLRKQTAEKWCRMNNTDRITPESINCLGCKQGGVKFAFCQFMCEIRKCAAKNEFSNCGECASISSCDKIKPFIDNNEEVRKNLLGE